VPALQNGNRETPWEKDRHSLFTPRHDFFSLDAGALNLFTQALGLPCWSLVLSFYEWSSKLAVRVTSGQAALTTDQVVVIETRDLAALTPAQVSALRSSQLEALTTSVRVERLLEAGSAAAMETAQVASFTSGQVEG